jgi:predicted SnoaL-like aldol condensation-catalyzing enzyme
MKSLIIGFASLLCMSCTDRSPVSSEAKGNSNAPKNLDAWHTVSMAFATGNQDAINTVIADDYIDHTSRGDFKGRDSVKANVARWHANLKDVKMEPIKEFADQDYAVFWMRFTGNSNGRMGIPVGPFDMTTVQVVRFKDGRAVEHWDYIDMKQMMQMMQSTK